MKATWNHSEFSPLTRHIEARISALEWLIIEARKPVTRMWDAYRKVSPLRRWLVRAPESNWPCMTKEEHRLLDLEGDRDRLVFTLKRLRQVRAASAASITFYPNELNNLF